jgi:hypothetical protein
MPRQVHPRGSGARFDTALPSVPGVRAPLGPFEEPFCQALEASAAGTAMPLWHPGRRPQQRRRAGVSLFGRRWRFAGGKHGRAAAATLLRGEGAENPVLDPRSARAVPPGLAAMGRLTSRGERP